MYAAMIPKWASDLDKATREAVIQDVSRDMLRRLLPGLPIYAALLVVVIVTTDFDANHPITTYSSLAVLAFVCALRYFVVKTDRLRTSRPYGRLWLAVFSNGGVFSGFLFSLLCLLAFFWDGWSPTSYLFMLGNAGLAAGAVTSIAPAIRVTRAYLVASTMPMLVTAALPSGYPLAIFFTIYMVSLLRLAQRAHTEYWKARINAALLALRATELDKARQKAEKASHAKGEFLASVSHEVRTPLNGIVGMTDLLLRMSLTREQEESVEIIRGSSEALLAVVNDILDLSKLEAGKLTIETSRVDMWEIIKDVVNMHHAKALEKGLECVVLTDRTAPRLIEGDEGRIRQVLVNLVGNAVKFTDEGYLFIHTSAETEADGPAVLKVEVEDTGIGIAEDKIGHVFGAFNQEDRSTTRRFGGTGLGLTISQHLAGLMGGAVSVSSTQGEGSTFTLTLPVENRGATSERGPGHGAKALVVESSALQRRALTRSLEQYGFVVASSPSWQAGLDALRSQEPKAGYLFWSADIGHIDEMLESIDENTVPIVLRKPLLPAHLDDTITRLVEKGEKAPPLRKKGARKKAAERPTPPAGNFEGPRILVAEDSRVNQIITQRMLEQFGCQVTIADNGIEAVRLVMEQPFDAVFMDCDMPEMDGYQATREIRQRQQGSTKTPIIALTASAAQRERDKAQEAGMDEFVGKPVKMHVLREVLAKTGSLSTKPHSDKDAGEGGKD